MSLFTAQYPFSLSGVSANLTAQCASWSLPSPTLFGAEILNVTSSVVSNYTAEFMPPTFFNSDPPLYGEATNLSFCNVTVTYTHPGQGDTINVNVWLPLSVADNSSPSSSSSSSLSNTTSPEWNGLFLSIGGGGLSMCLPDFVSHTSLAQGYAISKTDGGHVPAYWDYATESWAMLSEGNVNLYALQNFGSVALHDMAVIGKSVVESFYGVPPRYSYFKGCSTGGRQGLMIAQRYPDDYDGILAAAPAMYMPKLMVSHYWAQLVMDQLGEYPRACEFEAITAAAIEACDTLDGVKDGIVSAPDLCHFDPFAMVGTSISCTEHYADDDEFGHATEHTVNLTHAAAHVAAAQWRGPLDTTDTFLWHGFSHSSPLTGAASTVCFRNGTCQGALNSMASDWLRLFLYRNASMTDADLAAQITTRDDFATLFVRSEEEWHSYVATSDVDLRPFARRGGRLLAWHGGSDEAIMPAQTRAYYDDVTRFAELHEHNATDFFRFFLVPGVQHCGFGAGALPVDAMDKLRAWVEDDIAPEVLQGETFRPGGDEVQLRRPLCIYPKVARYKGHGDVRQAESFECAESF